MKFPILISYAYARDNMQGFQARANDPNIDVLLDSGAFTAKNTGREITLNDYCKFLTSWKDKLFRYLALDVVGDPIATEANLHSMLDRGLQPAPVHVLGDDEKRLDYLFTLSDYVALAGLRRPGKGHAPKQYVAAKTKWAKNRKVHWLGYVKYEMMAMFKPYSCDSASWAGAQMFGTCSVYLGGNRWVDCSFDTRAKLLANRTAMSIIYGLGFTLTNFNDPYCWRGATSKGYPCSSELPNVVTSDSWVRWVIDVYKHTGTRVFLACKGQGEREESSIFEAIRRHADSIRDC